ncbi:MAG: N-6 DNA methylase [Bacteroidales bacterium]|nr:N-6 DNA methylase [Bacteroidales bacterium]
MAKAVKQHGRVYTPDYLVNLILDFGNYNDVDILQKHVIDNSCGDGAFLIEIVSRYCIQFLSCSDNKKALKNDLEHFIHGIELDAIEQRKCIQNLNRVASSYGLSDVHWNIINADTLTVISFNGKMDYVFGNPPYVRVHNLESSYDAVKEFRFAEKGMTDLFIVFFEIGFKMLAKSGTMCLITPSSWLSSKAGKNLRIFIKHHKNLSGLIDLEHFQPFDATTYTLISRFQKATSFESVEYYSFNENILDKELRAHLSLEEISIGDSFYLSSPELLVELKRIKAGNSAKYVEVKNGFATLADKVFIGDFDFSEGTIDILKASTGKWSKCIYPYDTKGKPLPLIEFMEHRQAYEHLLANHEKLSKDRDVEDDNYWYLFGRTQALKDVSSVKYAINTIIKDKGSIKLEIVPMGKGIYSGLYILTKVDFDTIRNLIVSDDFIKYIKLLKNYKSGGYYTFASKDLEQYLNYKLTEIHGQSTIPNGNWSLF